MSMTVREKKLAAAFGLVILSILGLRFVNAVILDPIRERQETLAKREEAVNQLEYRELELLAAEANLTHAREISLPGDPLLAQRIYQEWLTDLANVFDFRGLVVKPNQRSSRSKVYTSVQVTLEARATHEQLTRFLYAFENAAVLHRISSLELECKDHRGNPPIDITLLAEALSMPESPSRDSVFPRLALEAPLARNATTMTWNNPAPPGFPSAVPFLIRIGTELIEVREVGDSGWKLVRGVKGTFAADHRADDPLELFRLRRDRSEITEQDISRIVANNFFVMPAEPVEYTPRLQRIGDQVATRGQTLSFQIQATGFPPETPSRFFEVDGDVPEGLYLDEESGDVIWEPEEEDELGEYDMTFYVYVRGEERQRFSERVTIRLRDPNTAPRLDLKPSYTVLAGTPFRLQFQAEDDESPPSDLTYSIEGELPEGATFNSSTGILNWITSENDLPRELQLTAIVTDRGDPPMSDEQSVTLSLIEDFTRDTYLTGIIKIDDMAQASLYNRAENVTSVLLEGKSFRAAGLSGRVLEIATEYVVCEMDDQIWRLDLGKPLFERSPAKGPARLEPVAVPVATNDSEMPLVAPRPSTDDQPVSEPDEE
jgi:hypothetical protein